MKNPLAVFSRRSQVPMRGPWRAMAELENELDRWFGERYTDLTEIPSGFDFSPVADLKETDTEYVLRLDVPGIRKEDISIEVENNCVTVRGERKEEKEEESAKRHYMEAAYGSFMRSFALPQMIEDSKVDAKYDAGVLTVVIPKNKKSSAKSVSVH